MKYIITQNVNEVYEVEAEDEEQAAQKIYDAELEPIEREWQHIENIKQKCSTIEEKKHALAKDEAQWLLDCGEFHDLYELMIQGWRGYANWSDDEVIKLYNEKFGD
jgi:hypothetical protein